MGPTPNKSDKLQHHLSRATTSHQVTTPKQYIHLHLCTSNTNNVYHFPIFHFLYTFSKSHVWYTHLTRPCSSQNTIQSALHSLQIRLDITDSIKPFVHGIRVQVRSIRRNAIFIFILVVRHGPPAGRLGLVFDVLGHGELVIDVLVFHVFRDLVEKKIGGL